MPMTFQISIRELMAWVTAGALGIVVMYQQHLLNTKTHLEIPAIRYDTKTDRSGYLPSHYEGPTHQMKESSP